MPDEPTSTPQGHTWLWPHGAMFVGTGMVNEPHRHFTASLLVAVEGELAVRHEHARGWQHHRAFLVAPNVEQELDARDATAVILQLDPETRSYARVAHWFEDGALVHAPGEQVVQRLAAARDALEGPEPEPERVWEAAIDALARPGGARRELDPRIAAVLSEIKRALPTPPPAGELAESVGLSESRLIHLFGEQMGLPLRRYALWLRVRDALFALANDASMTEAAHLAGFSDAAHLSRTFRSMFGMPPSQVVKPSRRMRVEFRLPPPAELEAPHQLLDLERWADAFRAIAARQGAPVPEGLTPRNDEGNGP